jgi:uncharacterized protein (TIGR00255 family)
MIQSMTGYGRATCEFKNKKFTIEIKSLNSKQADISTRIPNYFKEKEMEIRSAISKTLQRGKIDMSLYIENLEGDTSTAINKAVFANYKKQIQHIATAAGAPEPSDYFSVILRLPDSLKSEIQELDDEEWAAVNQTLQNALESLNSFRIQEGKSLESDLRKKIDNIRQLSAQVQQYEAERIEKVRARLLEGLSDLKSSIEFDSGRFEQELIFYAEKLDINEEKVRLANHCNYFIETVETDEFPGKKIGFIAQEIGREINTLGSKANHHEIQKLVVQMKDELEQIKEQALNIL